MIVSIIAAVDEKGGIGFKGRIPWHLPADLARFKKLTMGHHLILGRKTFRSIGGPLPGRTMIVLSRDEGFHPEGCWRASSLDEAFELASSEGETEVFVIGGGEIYRLALPAAERLYLTRVSASLEVDTYFPPWEDKDWQEICSQVFPADERNSIPHTFSFYLRNQG